MKELKAQSRLCFGASLWVTLLSFCVSREPVCWLVLPTVVPMAMPGSLVSSLFHWLFPVDGESLGRVCGWGPVCTLLWRPQLFPLWSLSSPAALRPYFSCLFLSVSLPWYYFIFHFCFGLYILILRTCFFFVPVAWVCARAVSVLHGCLLFWNLCAALLFNVNK